MIEKQLNIFYLDMTYPNYYYIFLINKFLLWPILPQLFNINNKSNRGLNAEFNELLIMIIFLIVFEIQSVEIITFRFCNKKKIVCSNPSEGNFFFLYSNFSSYYVSWVLK